MSKFKDFFVDKLDTQLLAQRNREAARQKIMRQGAGERMTAWQSVPGVDQNGIWAGDFATGVELLRIHFKPKFRVLPDALKQLEFSFGPIKWSSMRIKAVPTLRFMEYNGYRSDVEVNGTVEKDGTPVQYRYMQSPAAQTGMRMFRYGNSGLKMFSALTGIDFDRKQRGDPYAPDRARHHFDFGNLDKYR